jgi:hypothetical protein
VKLYVNGDSHAAGAEAVSPAAFAEDDGHTELGRRPHPANLAVSWGQQLANRLGVELVCDAESAASNYRILRTTRAWMQRLRPWESAMAIIQWSTWEREEWLHNGEYLQVGSSGLDWVPEELADRYKQFVANVDWAHCQQYWHNEIWKLHQELTEMKIPHVFFNGNTSFNQIRKQQFDWNNAYIAPYSLYTYDHILRESDFEPVSKGSWHFGKDAHCFWAEFVLQYCIENNILDPNAISSD